MKVVLYMAITANGYIAKPDGNTDWVCETDWNELEKFVGNSDTVLMGKKTWQVSGDDFPYGSCLNVVMTNDILLLSKKEEKVMFTDKSPRALVKALGLRGFSRLLIIGGGITNSIFAKSGVIDEVLLSVHPLIFGKGIKLFADSDFGLSLKLLTVKTLNEGLVQLRYQVKK
ncbi:hypothetical protein A2982_02060 [candidate division WWE3 bacterium RIFCSPLOWO2_01_FULL_39_13]|uniref:Bacterial bifunctional deaminase-reductase C-terminal domain-containing protein n=1 Tax=candidate division WWE3 bacterium RIFCSPLOWO2_01_FULL_39_13 TaxID=1802624 RepID=A0A1F4V3L0_UNCKA|nr:MAG: hypothetical protein A2982_02060 [candidate division WWE3 bacterium RIFCSPLOWO2_01_FULL_39_13]